MKQNNPFDVKRIRYVEVLVLLVICMGGVASADDYVGGLPLTTVQSGTVSGDLWFDAIPPSFATGVTKDFTLPAVALGSNVQWARLYISTYNGHMQEARNGSITIQWDNAVDGNYEATWTENLNVPFIFLVDGGNNNTARGGGSNDPYRIVNDHCNRVTSDYLMWYDVKDLLTTQNIRVKAEASADGSSFDGRIKVVTLVVAYNDGDSDEIMYWVNQGHDSCSYYTEDNYGEVAVGSTSFSTTGLSGISSATLTSAYMASNNGYYGFPTDANNFDGLTKTGSFTNVNLDRTPDVQGTYSGVKSWNVTSGLDGSNPVTLGYARYLPGTGNAAFFKIPLALLTARMDTSPSYNLTVTNVNPVTANLFAREPNTMRITVRNNGPDTSPPAEVGLTSSDGFIGTATVPSLAPNTQNMTQIVDTTVRPDAGATITYNATVGISSKTVSKVVTYNGYKGKRYWEGGNDVTTKRTFDLRGGFLVSPGDSHYVSGGVGGAAWNSYDVNWTGADLPVPEGATIREVWLYAPYTWDNSGQVPDHFHLAFNGQSLPYEDHYQDVSNFGAYYNYYYGLLSYNVTSLFNPSGNNATVGKDDADSKLAMYGLTLAVIYEKPGEPRRQIFMNEEFDILGADATGYATTPEEATAYVPFSGLTIVPGNVSAADLITFVPSGNMFEGDLLLNDDTIATNVWDYGESSGTQVAVDVRDVKAYLNAVGNIVGIRSTAGATPLMAASHEFLVVTYAEAVPVANFTGSPTTGNAPLNVQFTDSSTGTVNSWAWDFTNDGTVDSSLQNPDYTYASAGTYSVKLNVTGPGGSNAKLRTDYITVSVPPVAPAANFTGNPTSGNAPLIVQFTDSSTGTITSYAWDFTNDGTVDSTLQNPNYTYSSSGTYSVKLNVTGPGGSDAKFRTDYITVSALPLVAAFTATPINGLTPLSVTFTDQSSGTITSRLWEYRSGSGSWTEFSTIANPARIFTDPGPYDIRLTVGNSTAENTATKTRYISVSGGPAPLTTVTSGNVSGDLYVGAFQPVAWGLQPATGVASRDFDQTFSLPPFTDIQWARLYVNVYSGSGGGNWPLRTTVSFDGNGDGSYESVLGVEDMDIQGASDGNAYPLNDHCNRVFSDYNTWYDVTGLISATNPAALVKTEQMPPGTYDGRLKTITLVVAYNDGDTDEVWYWVNAGHDYQGSSESGHQTTFSTNLLPSGWTSADLTDVHLASKDSTYTFNTVLYTGANPVAPVNFFGKNSWNATSSLHTGSTSNFTYTHAASSSYKTILATLKAKYSSPGPVAPVANFTVNQTSGLPPLAVQFTDLSTGSLPMTYLWHFGDGTTSDALNPVHTYSSWGFFLPNLTVSNSAGNSTKTLNEPITVMGSIGGDTGYFLVHCNVDGALVSLDDHYEGVIENGTLLIQVYTTATPAQYFTVWKEGYQVFTGTITDHPSKDETVDLYAELVPFSGVYVHLDEGWNLFSTPVGLDASHDSWKQIFTVTAREQVTQVLGWNGIWFVPGEDDPVEPLNAYYVKVDGSTQAWLVPSLEASPPPSRELPGGISLIGPATAYDQGTFPAMPLDQALISIADAQSGKMGYTMVVSPNLNQPGWGYARGGSIRDLLPFKGYWVVMENPDTLYGFSTTPIV